MNKLPLKQPVPVITVDGPSSSGKGTVSQLLAQRLDWHFLDSGAIYRVLALAISQRGINLDAVSAIAAIGQGLDVVFRSFADPSSTQVILEGADVTDAIRTPECGKLASQISVFPEVRSALLARQRAFSQPPGLVADGRDMGTVIFPDAPLKIYLDATCEERSRRRFLQLKHKVNHVTFEQIFAELSERDRRDMQREVAPLKPAQDAMIIDTTALGIQEVVDIIWKTAGSRELLPGTNKELPLTVEKL